MKSYILPLLCGLFLLVAILMTVLKCNDRPLPDNKQRIKELEKSEQFYRNLADSLSKNSQFKIDTLIITKTKLKLKNDTIWLQQQATGSLSADSSFEFFCRNTGATVIHD